MEFGDDEDELLSWIISTPLDPIHHSEGIDGEASLQDGPELTGAGLNFFDSKTAPDRTHTPFGNEESAQNYEGNPYGGQENPMRMSHHETGSATTLPIPPPPPESVNNMHQQHYQGAEHHFNPHEMHNQYQDPYQGQQYQSYDQLDNTHLQHQHLYQQQQQQQQQQLQLQQEARQTQHGSRLQPSHESPVDRNFINYPDQPTRNDLADQGFTVGKKSRPSHDSFIESYPRASQQKGEETIHAGNPKRRRMPNEKRRLVELNERLRELKTENALYKLILGGGVISPGDLDSKLGELDRALLAKKNTEVKTRKIITGLWDEHESFGTADRARVVAQFFSLARLLVGFNSQKYGAKLLDATQHSIIRDILGIDRLQVSTLTAKSRQAHELFMLYGTVCEGVASARARYDKAVELFSHLVAALKQTLLPTQLGRFVSWVHGDTACKEILSQLWESTMSGLKERVVTDATPSGTSEDRAVLRELRYDRLSQLKDVFLKTIEEGDMKRLFHASIIFVDRTTNAQAVGMEETLELCRRLPLAQSVTEHFMRFVDISTAQCTWFVTTSSGEYELASRVIFAASAPEVVNLHLAWTPLANAPEIHTITLPPAAQKTGTYTHHPESRSGSSQLQLARAQAIEQLLKMLQSTDTIEVQALIDAIVTPETLWLDTGIIEEYRGPQQNFLYHARLRKNFPVLVFDNIEVIPITDDNTHVTFSVDSMWIEFEYTEAKPCEFYGSISINFIPDSHRFSQLTIRWKSQKEKDDEEKEQVQGTST